VFAQQVLGYGRAGDIFLGISTSGNSRNVLYAAITAKAKGLRVVGLTGETGGKLAPLCDICLNVPESETYKIQELHLPVYHALCLAVERMLF
jgi:D-sedoheptulose 7-phosphate isomerase